jgi:hypothetical protein
MGHAELNAGGHHALLESAWLWSGSEGPLIYWNGPGWIMASRNGPEMVYVYSHYNLTE